MVQMFLIRMQPVEMVATMVSVKGQLDVFTSQSIMIVGCVL